tara:strand:- start:1266 stop:3443 length:2178 start_codon:yes stop_codon:yes gene_type:complete
MSLKRDNRGFIFKSGPSKSKSQFSSFWMDNNDDEYNELFGTDTEKPKGKDVVKLASYRSAIANFVTILTGESIPVEFNSRGDSYTDGKKVVLGSNLNDKNFDVAVGLALHEGSHIKLSDFNHLKNLESNIPAELFILAEAKGIGRNDVVKQVKNLLNYVEDRRIDYYVFRTSPGYKGYYHSMYDKYFYSKVIDKMLLSEEMRTEDWDSYEARIINLHNKNRQLGSLKGLKEIWNIINLPNISRLKSSVEAAKVAFDVYRIILSNISKVVTEEESGGQNGNSDSQPSTDSESSDLSDEQFQELLDSIENGEMESSSDGSSSGGSSIKLPSDVSSNSIPPSENMSNDDGSEPIELSDRQKSQLKKALKKQSDFIDGNIKKGKLSKKDMSDVKAIEESGASYENVGNGIPKGWSGDVSKGTKCLVVKKLTKGLIESNIFRCATEYNLSRYNTTRETYLSREYNFVKEGLRLGTVLGRKLQVRSEERSLKYTRKDTGKIDRRLIAELGFGNENVFSQTFVDRYNKAYLHISIDASGSMCGNKWNKAMTSAIAMIKAADMSGNIDVVVSIRATHNTAGHYGGSSSTDVPMIMVCYDSRIDKLQKVKNLFGALDVTGTTPEGLCFEAIAKELIPGNNNQDSYFINFSDGQPYYSNSSIDYRGHYAENHTRKMVNDMKDMGLKVMSYFIGDDYSYGNDKESFTKMYGKDASFINATNMMQVAKTMNDKFLQK